jgi:hypothetical protein
VRFLVPFSFSGLLIIMTSTPRRMDHDICARCRSTVSTKAIVAMSVPESPVPHLLGTNLTPLVSECSSIQQTVYEAQSHISSLDFEIVRVQRILDALSSKRRAMVEHVKGHRALLSPVRRIPSELISMIFLWCLRNEVHREYAVNAPWVLGWVCREWRDIALSTQKLWSEPKLCLFKQPSKADIALATNWLIRAGRCPLSITISGDCKTAHPVLTMVLNHSELWESLDLHLPFPIIRQFAAAKNRLLRLQKLSLRFKTGNQHMVMLDTFQVASQLRHVCLGDGAVFSFIKIPWRQLTSIHTTWQDFDSAIGTLQQCPNLVECNMGVLWSQAPARHSPVRLARLQTLHIRGPAEFFDYLALPALHALHVACNFGASHHPSPQPGYKSWLPRFISLLSRSSCALEMLSIRLGARPLDGDDLVQLLEHIPSLVKLKIEGRLSFAFAGSAMDRLTCREPGTWLVPNLRFIDVECRSDPFDVEAFATLIRSRWRTYDHADRAEVLRRAKDEAKQVPACLQTVHLCINTPRHNAQLNPLRKLMYQGLDIVVVSVHRKSLL